MEIIGQRGQRGHPEFIPKSIEAKTNIFREWTSTSGNDEERVNWHFVPYSVDMHYYVYHIWGNIFELYYAY